MSLGISAAGWAAAGAIGSVGASLIGSSKAASAQRDAANAAGATSDRQFDITRQDQLDLLAQQRADQLPYREAGYRSLEQIMAGIQPGSDFNRRFGLNDFQQDPGYQFRLQEGEAALRRAAAASGNAYSGSQLKALARFNSGLADQEYGDAYNRFNTDQSARFNRLASLAGIGQTATNQVQSAGSSAYGNIASLGAANAAALGRSAQDAAEARASGYVSASNAIGSGIKSLYNNFYPTGGGGSAYIAPSASSQNDYLAAWGV